MLPLQSKWGGVNYTFGNFDVEAYSAAGNASYDISGNLWAPDVIWNKKMEKWCMYLSINGQNANCSIVLLTSDNIEGPYLYQGPIVFSGFNIGSNAAINYTNTDLEIALGTQASLPDRYDVGTLSGWRQRWPNAIDPCVFYDETGKLWMSYGSWHGGIWMLELDENTGLRDYDVEYPITGSGNNVTSDPYFGTKIAGGFHVSGEASYIKYIDGYYYLFITYGGLVANGGYQMRVFRSTSPTGPYEDTYHSGGVAIYDAARVNYGPDGTRKTDRGENIFGAYGEWGYATKGDYSERSQGHNSVITNGDQTFLVYHTRFQNRGDFHEVRVHQMFINQLGWLCAAPFEYTGETVTNTDIKTTQQVATADIPGTYKLLLHDMNLDHTNMQLNTPVNVELKSDGTITGDKTGTWEVPVSGKSYINIVIDGLTYEGVMIEQTMEPTDRKVPAFSAVNRKESSTAGGNTLWGYKVPADESVIGAVNKGWTDAGSQTSGYKLATGKTLTFTFTVDETGTNAYDGYLGILTKANKPDWGENQYVFLRSLCDYAVGGTWNAGATYNENTYGGVAPIDFLTGSTVTMEIKRVGTRVAIAVDIRKNGTTYTHFYLQDLGTTDDVYAFLAADEAQLTLIDATITDNDNITGTLIGEIDKSSGFFGAFSDYYRLLPEQSLKLKFKNYSNKIQNYNNFLAYVTNDAERGTGSYSEYFGMRADNYVLVTKKNTDANNFDVLGWDWSAIKEAFDGAEVELTVTRTGSAVKMRADITPSNGMAPLYEEYTLDCGDGTQPIRVFLSIEHAYLDLLSAEVGTTISAYDWSTFVTGNALDFSAVDGLTAYAVTGHDGTNINKVEVTSAVPAGTPLLLNGDANATYFIPVAASAGTAPSGNLLQVGTGASVAPESGKTKYALSVEAGAAQFKKIEAARAIPVGKAFLVFNEDISAREFSLDGSATGIQHVKVGAEDHIYYDLQGRRVLYPKKGLYIVNGKKVVIK